MNTGATHADKFFDGPIKGATPQTLRTPTISAPELYKYQPFRVKNRTKKSYEIVIFGEPSFSEVMDIQTEKLRLIERLLQIRDISIIEQIRELLNKTYNPIVGYTANGNSISQQDFIQQIEQAENEYKSGNYQSLDEVEKESETW